MACDEGNVVAVQEADFALECPISLHFGPAITGGGLHIVTSLPIELRGMSFAFTFYGAGEAIDGEHAALLVELDA